MKRCVRRGDPERQRHWEEVMRRWREGGQAVRAFCRTEGVRESAFYFWRRKLARRGDREDAEDTSRPASGRATRVVRPSSRRSPGHRPTPSFLPVRVVMPASRLPNVVEAVHPVEIVLAEGRIVRVPAGFDRQTLLDVLAVLEVRSC